MTKDLVREVAELLEAVHRMELSDRDKQPAKRRMVLDLSEASETLMAWLAVRRRMEIHGQDGPSHFPISLLYGRHRRALARYYCAFLLNEHLRLELHALATGTHPILRDRTVVTTIKGGLQ